MKWCLSSNFARNTYGTATIAAGAFRDWIENRLGKRILKALQSEVADITAVRFVV